MKHETGNRALDRLRAFARYKTHGGYVWAAVTADGDLLCERCVLANYRAHYKATKAPRGADFSDAIVGLADSGGYGGGGPEYCADCGILLWGAS